ncbi:GNAT family N-acetyltransferase [Aminobacter anthyllidis]|uniref:GNAT family N-acetyltransferase n=1 Tax=Aminobacter anthyllidis TaxID=1035067 RepID=A0A9X1AAE7_9HYPH|nr:GNAT family N-acetyltransferase [Aminobacter anthyllidis]MBT1155872.1 GNAT family N-acetyltransferase [Aminobacter anthyllidis]
MKIALKLLHIDEIASVTGIELDEHDEDLAGGSMTTIYERLRRRPELSSCHPFIVTVECTTVGFVMLREGPALPYWAKPGAISLHNFRISRKAQGRGFGTAAMALAAVWIAVHRPGSSSLTLSVNEDNSSALRLYRRCGFETSGHFVGRLGTELVLSCDVSELLKKYVAGRH